MLLFSRFIGAKKVQDSFYTSILLLSLKHYMLCNRLFKQMEHRKAVVQRYMLER